jgi:hypothetical protein
MTIVFTIIFHAALPFSILIKAYESKRSILIVVGSIIVIVASFLVSRIAPVFSEDYSYTATEFLLVILWILIIVTAYLLIGKITYDTESKSTKYQEFTIAIILPFILSLFIVIMPVIVFNFLIEFISNKAMESWYSLLVNEKRQEITNVTKSDISFNNGFKDGVL